MLLILKVFYYRNTKGINIFYNYLLWYFTDVNECVPEFDNCHGNAQCNNTDGSFVCICNEGYTENGVICESKWTKLWY
jgi:hypothetical protein